jgi:prepilin-type N-terminal cleavage/methylation domain-containing protein
MIRQTKQQGFTLTELMIAMAFVSFVLLFIVFAMLQVMGNYNKGLAVKQINQTGRTVMEEISRLARSTNAEAINTSQLSSGRLCFGGVGYVWNVRDDTINKYTDNSLVSMARVEDSTVCNSTLPNINKAKATSLLTDQVWVQSITASLGGNNKLLTFGVRLSTSGDNRPTVSSPDGLICGGDRTGNYCSVTAFSTTVSTRNGGE